jgi:hypothetical protein
MEFRSSGTCTSRTDKRQLASEIDMKYRERKQVAATYRREYCTRWERNGLGVLSRPFKNDGMLGGPGRFNDNMYIRVFER